MNRYRFELSNTDFYCIARDFRSACIMFDSAGLNPLDILSIAEHRK